MISSVLLQDYAITKDFKMSMTEIYEGIELPELKDWERGMI